MDIPTLQGEGLSLRHLTAADAPALLRSWGDPANMTYMSRPALADVAAAEDFIAGIDELKDLSQLLQWGVVPEGEREVVGTVTLVLTDLPHQTADLGFCIQRDRWGQGIATRAARPVRDYAFAELGIHRLQADADPRNEGSLRVLAKLGFQREGLMRGRYLQLGERQDAVLLSLVRGSS